MSLMKCFLNRETAAAGMFTCAYVFMLVSWLVRAHVRWYVCLRPLNAGTFACAYVRARMHVYVRAHAVCVRLIVFARVCVSMRLTMSIEISIYLIFF